MNEPEEKSTTKTRSLFSNRFFRIGLRVILAVVLFFALVFAWFLFDNNYSASTKTAEQMNEEIDRVFDRGLDWIENETSELCASDANPAMLYMLRDMQNPESYSGMQDIVDYHVKRGSNNLWHRMVDPTFDIPRVGESQVKKIGTEYQRWLAYAIAPEKVTLPEKNYTAFLDSEMNSFRHLSHQLLAVYILQQTGGFKEKNLDELSDRLCERIAGETALDFRVTDLYIQRVAALLVVGRSDLVKRRWVERIMAYQSHDGGFPFAWYGWGPGAIKFGDFRPSTDHSTIQAVWIMYMLKHRCPEWVDENYAG